MPFIENLVLSRLAVFFLSFKSGLHLLAVLVAGACGKLLHALLGGAPFDNGDFHNATPPLAHETLGGLVDVNGAGAYEGTAVVVDDVGIGLTFNLELGAQWVNRPVCGSTAHIVIVDEVGADSVFRAITDVVAFGVGVSGRADNSVELLGVVKRHAVLVASQVRQLGRRTS